MENGPGLKMYFLLNIGIFHCYVSLPEGTLPETNGKKPLKIDPGPKRTCHVHQFSGAVCQFQGASSQCMTQVLIVVGVSPFQLLKGPRFFSFPKMVIKKQNARRSSIAGSNPFLGIRCNSRFLMFPHLIAYTP